MYWVWLFYIMYGRNSVIVVIGSGNVNYSGVGVK